MPNYPVVELSGVHCTVGYLGMRTRNRRGCLVILNSIGSGYQSLATPCCKDTLIPNLLDYVTMGQPFSRATMGKKNKQPCAFCMRRENKKAKVMKKENGRKREKGKVLLFYSFGEHVVCVFESTCWVVKGTRACVCEARDPSWL